MKRILQEAHLPLPQFVKSIVTWSLMCWPKNGLYLRWGKSMETVNICPGLFYLPDYKHPWILAQFVYIFPITMEVSIAAV